MHVQVEIGGETRSLGEADEQWINDAINRRRRDGISVCVRVLIQDSDVDLALSTPGCPVSRGSRPATVEEQPILDLWRKRRLDQAGFTGGDVVAFLKQLTR